MSHAWIAAYGSSESRLITSKRNIYSCEFISFFLSRAKKMADSMESKNRSKDKKHRGRRRLATTLFPLVIVFVLPFSFSSRSSSSKIFLFRRFFFLQPSLGGRRSRYTVVRFYIQSNPGENRLQLFVRLHGSHGARPMERERRPRFGGSLTVALS